VILLLWLGCSDYHFDEGGNAPPRAGTAPAIAASPVALTFPSLRVVTGESDTQPILITNVGNATLDLDGATIVGDAAFSIGTLGAESLEPGRTTTLDATFRPTTGKATWSVVRIESNDPQQPETDVELFGEGLAPDLLVTPAVLDLGTVLPGCTVEHDVEIRNVGRDDLTITDATLFDASPALTWIPIDRTMAALPWTLQPDERVRSRLTYAPADEGQEVAQLDVASNDPEEPTATSAIEAVAGTATVEDVYEQPDVPAADILFVVDDSSSMEDEQAALALYGSRLVSTLEESTTRWQIAVITTSSPSLRGPVITPDTGNVVAEFETQITPGVNGAHAEKGIEMAYDALHWQAAPGTTFFRDGARLVLIFISDEEEQSEIVDPWDAAAYLQTIKDPRLVLAHSITALAGDGCTVESYGTRYAELTSLVGGLRMSICSDWSSIVDDLADSAVVQLDRFQLSRTPHADSIEVRVDGHPATGWVYDEPTNEVVFETAAAVPEAGAEVSITYQVGGCDP
jgi:hypothetical protein